MSDTSDLPPAKRPKIEVDAQTSQDSQTYGLHVTAEEVDQLREFQVLDEIKCDDEDSNDEGSDKTDSSDGTQKLYILTEIQFIIKIFYFCNYHT